MSADPRLVLRRPRDAGAVVADAFRLYRRNLWTMLALGFAIVAPVQLAVMGLGLERLFSDYDATPPLEHQVVEIAATFLVIAPLLVATTAHALIAAERGELRGPGAPLVAGLETFAPLFWAIAITGVVVSLGLLALILPGIWLLIRLYLVSQAVALESRRGTDALMRSWELTQDAWWRSFGIVVLAQLAALLPALLLGGPFEAWADSADASAIALAGNILTLSLVGPFTAIAATLLYFDLRARKEGVPHDLPAPGPPPPEALDRPEAPLNRPDR